MVVGKKTVRPVVLALALLAERGGLSTTATATQSLTASFTPIAKLSVPATLTLTPSGATKFTPFEGTLTLNYRVRSTSGGGGSITVQVTSDFSPAGGPSAAGGVLTYTCGSANFGTPASGAQTASTSSQTPVLTLPASACTGGGGACSSQDPNSMNVTFIVPDDPGYATGSYSARLTFTISAT